MGSTGETEAIMGKRKASVEAVIEAYKKIGWTQHPDRMAMVNPEGGEVDIVTILEQWGKNA